MNFTNFIVMAFGFIAVGNSESKFDLNSKIKMCGSELTTTINYICESYKNDVTAMFRTVGDVNKPYIDILCCLTSCSVKEIVKHCRSYNQQGKSEKFVPVNTTSNAYSTNVTLDVDLKVKGEMDVPTAEKYRSNCCFR